MTALRTTARRAAGGPPPSCSTSTRSSSSASCAATRGSSPARAASASAPATSRLRAGGRTAGSAAGRVGRGRGLARGRRRRRRAGPPVAVGAPDRLPLYARRASRAASIVVARRARGRYLPRQSIRTLADARPPRAPPPQARAVDPQHVRLPRPAARPHARRAGADAWLRRASPPTRSCDGLVLLGEVASVSVAHSAFEAIAGVPYQHTEMLGAIWREPVEAAPARRRAGDHDGGADPPRRGRRVVRRAADRAQRPGRRATGCGGCTRSRCRRCCTCSTASARRSRRTRRTASSCCATTSRCGSSSRTSSTTR